MPLTNPPLIPEAFAALGDKNTIPDAPGAPGAASWDSGFPVETEEPLTSGGIPPDRLDFNGVLFSMSEHTTFLQEGGAYFWDSVLGAAGYAEGSVVVLVDGYTKAVCLVDGNTNNPNTTTMLTNNWAPAGSVMGMAACYGVAGGTANAITVATGVPFTPNVNTANAAVGGRVVFSASAGNTGAVTISVNGSTARALLTNTGQPLQAGDLVTAGIYEAIFSSQTTLWHLVGHVPSQPHTSSYARFGPVGDVYAGAGAAGMLGLGSTLTFTPSQSGVCSVDLAGVVFDTVTEGASASVRYGTGAAPALGDGATGTQWSGAYDILVTAGSAGSAFSFPDILNLTPGTPYWFDILFPAPTGLLNITNVTFKVVEL